MRARHRPRPRAIHRRGPTLRAAFMAVPALAAFLLPVAAALPAAAQARVPGPHRAPTPARPPTGLSVALAHAQQLIPTDPFCRRTYAHPCYSPSELRTAYGVNALTSAGDTGVGQTIVIIDSFGSPDIRSDLQQFDTAYGLPPPPSFTIDAPLGTVPFDASNFSMIVWAEETSLDVEWAHAMAPGAGLVLLTSPVAETGGTTGLPQFLQLEQYALANHLGDILTQSWGSPENTLVSTAGRQLISQFDALYQQAAAAGITVLAASGDHGSAQGGGPAPSVQFPASSPWVTAVGGTSLQATVTGQYRSEVAWDDASGATGGGVSQLEPEPAYQQCLPAADQSLLHGNRGLPDVALNADWTTPVPIVMNLPGSLHGFFLVGGTSEGSPAWAGIVADLDQRAGTPLGFLNPLLYRLGCSGGLAGIMHDVTTGTNTWNGVPGFSAGPGWDPVTGWGSPCGLTPCARCGGTPVPTGAAGGLVGGSACTATAVPPGQLHTGPVAGMAASPDGGGYWEVTAGGGVVPFGDAPFSGSMAGHPLNRPVVGIAPTPDGGGTWLVAADGGVFAFGDATFHGSLAGHHLDAPVVGMAPSPDGGGYWLVAADGGIFAFGDATFHGSLAGRRLDAPVVGMASTLDGGGYWLVAADGGVFAFGDARFAGSMAGHHLNQPVVGVAPSPDGGGYWLVAADGGIFAFGDARFAGSTAGHHLNQPVVGVAPSPDGGGYWLTAADGGIFAFGDARFAGSTA